jgi:HrpA-like RNA helicase
MSAEEQEAVCQGTGTVANRRRIIIATEVAETGVTVGEVRDVIDTGYVQRPALHHITGEASLTEVMISKASAQQRAGRAAREGPGTAWRLYTHEDFNNMDDHSPAGVCADDFFNVYWKMRQLGIHDVAKTSDHFIDIPRTSIT